MNQTWKCDEARNVPRPSLIWNVVQHRLVVSYRRLGEKKPIVPKPDRCCPKTSVPNYSSTLRNIPVEPKSHLHGAGSLKVAPKNVVHASRFELGYVYIGQRYRSPLYGLGLSRQKGISRYIVTRLRAGRSGVRIAVRARVFSKSSRHNLGRNQPRSQWVPGFVSGGKAAGTPRSSARVKNKWTDTSTPPPLCLHGVSKNSFILFTLCADAAKR